MRALVFLLAASCTLEGDGPGVDFDPTDPTVDEPTDPGTEEATPIDVLRPTSATMLASSDGHRAYAVDLDRDSIAVFTLEDGATTEVAVGDEPTRLTAHDDLVWVTLRAEGSIVRLREDGDTLVEEARAEVGAEPYDVVYNPWDDQLYVTLSQEDAVVQLDPTTLAETHRWTVPGEPRWIGVPPFEGGGGNALHVASVMQARVTSIDPEADVVVARPLPQPPRFTADDCDDRLLERRITGEVGTSWDGQTLYVPTLFADTKLPSPPATPGGTAPTDPPDRCSQEIEVSFVDMYYGGLVRVETPASLSRFEPTLLAMPLDGESDARRIHLGTQGLTATGELAARRGYPRSLAMHHEDGETVGAFVTMEATNDVLYLDLLGTSDEDRSPGFDAVPRLSVNTPEGPVATAIVGDFFYTYHWIDRSIAAFGRRNVTSQPQPGGNDSYTQPGYIASMLPSTLPADVQAGRLLFYSAENPRVVDPSFGTSCSNCHADGRTDGITWQFPDLPRQTPSLAGRVSDTVPLTWQENVPSVAMEAMITSTQRMNGEGLTLEEADQMAAFIDSTRDVLTPSPDASLVALGDEVFHRPEVGCAACHTGEAGTDGNHHAVRNGAVTNTPALRGIAATAPYFHDGGAATLMDVLELSRDGSMGDTSSLSDEEMAALEAYLRSW
jgi:mono/diheme cytochrome c family protein